MGSRAIGWVWVSVGVAVEVGWTPVWGIGSPCVGDVLASGVASHRLGMGWCRGDLGWGWAMAPLLPLGWGWAVSTASPKRGMGNGSTASPRWGWAMAPWLPLGWGWAMAPRLPQCWGWAKRGWAMAPQVPLGWGWAMALHYSHTDPPHRERSTRTQPLTKNPITHRGKRWSLTSTPTPYATLHKGYPTQGSRPRPSSRAIPIPHTGGSRRTESDLHRHSYTNEAKERVQFWYSPRCPFTTEGKPIPLQAWTGPECSRRLSFPDFKTIGT